VIAYLDTSALLKVVKPERETEALRAWLACRPAGCELITSALSRVEIVRTLRRDGLGAAQAESSADQALAGVHLLAVTNDVMIRANGYGMRRLGSLDAIHLASADRYRAELTDFVTYDEELAAAAANLGLAVLAPS
jgi:uncharacterized protein